MFRFSTCLGQHIVCNHIASDFSPFFYCMDWYNVAALCLNYDLAVGFWKCISNNQSPQLNCRHSLKQNWLGRFRQILIVERLLNAIVPYLISVGIFFIFRQALCHWTWNRFQFFFGSIFITIRSYIIVITSSMWNGCAFFSISFLVCVELLRHEVNWFLA